jgi:hypothetical protein
MSHSDCTSQPDACSEGSMLNTYIRLQHLTKSKTPLSKAPQSLPSMRHAHSLLNLSSPRFTLSSQTKCPTLVFAPIVKCRVSPSTTYSYTISLISVGNMLKNRLCACALVRALKSSSCFRACNEPKRRCDFGFGGALSRSRAVFRTPGRRVRSLGVIVQRT